jgi:hypothetical protein
MHVGCVKCHAAAAPLAGGFSDMVVAALAVVSFRTLRSIAPITQGGWLRLYA